MSCNHPECKELAKLLEIEPKDKCVLQECDNCNYLIDKLCITRPYPCFYEPKNFAKLLEITIGIESEFFFFLSESPQKFLINYLLKIDNEKRLNAYRDIIKQVNCRY